MIHRLFALVPGREAEGQIVPGLMVVGVPLDGFLEASEVPEGRRLLGKFEGSTDPGEGRITGLFLRHHRQHALGILDLARIELELCETSEGGHVVGLLLEHRRIEFRSPGEVTLFDQSHSLTEGGLDRRRARGTGEALVEGDDGRDRLDAKRARDGRVFVDIHLGQDDLARRRLYDLLQHRRELLARPAPRRPEIHQNGTVHGFRDDILPEGGRRDVLDEVVGLAGRSATSAEFVEH